MITAKRKGEFIHLVDVPKQSGPSFIVTQMTIEQAGQLIEQLKLACAPKLDRKGFTLIGPTCRIEPDNSTCTLCKNPRGVLHINFWLESGLSLTTLSTCEVCLEQMLELINEYSTQATTRG